MTNKERRDAQMAYISDESIMEEQADCRKKLQKLNFRIVLILKGLQAPSKSCLENQKMRLSTRRFTVIMARISKSGRIFLLIITVRFWMLRK